MKLHLKNVATSAPPLAVDVRDGASVADLKAAAAAGGAGAPADRLRLVFRGHVLKDGEGLADKGERWGRRGGGGHRANQSPPTAVHRRRTLLPPLPPPFPQA